MAKAKKKQSGKKGSTLMILGISLLMIAGIGYSFILVIVGMLPSLIARVIDRTPNAFRFKTVAAMNFSGILPYLSILIRQGNSLGAVKEMMGNGTMWLFIYGAAAIGWAIVWLAPYTIKYVLLVFGKSRIASLESDQATLVEEWGEAVKTGQRSLPKNT